MNYISLGYFCSVAMELERMGLRNESSPFDWVISDFEGVITVIENHFKDFLNYDDLSQNKNSREVYKNTKYNIRFYHDFDKYISLNEQLPMVQEKYTRRIERFYRVIESPTLFIRYISDRECDEEKSKELIWIENNYDKIISLIKSFNKDNDILFIANEGVTSDKFLIYNVPKDKDDVVARSPIHKNPTLFKQFSNVDFPNRQMNINRYAQKEKKKNSIYNRMVKKIKAALKAKIRKEYVHTNQY